MDDCPTPSTVTLMRQFNVVINHCPTPSTVNLMRQSNTPQLESPKAPFPIMRLAPELHLIVSRNLDVFDRISLKRTNRYFYKTIPAFQAKEVSRAQHQLYRRRVPAKQAIPGTNVKNDKDPYLACMCCRRLRPMLKFADEQQRYSPRLKVPHYLTWEFNFPKDIRMPRICISCGIFNGKAGYLPGDIIKLSEKEVVVCHFCKQYGWIGAHETRRRAAGLCDKCWKVLEVNRPSGMSGSHQDEM